MNWASLHPANRLVLGYLLFILAGLVSSKYLGVGFRPFAFVAGVAIISTLVYLHSFRLNKRTVAMLKFIDDHAILLLLIWMIVYLTWCGLVLFSNPYKYEINHGDAVFYVQTLSNLVNGMNPESSFFTINGNSLAGEDPRYANTHGYVSIFSLHQYWLPMILLTPLYAIFPQPPMHLFVLQIVVVGFGLPGVYWAVRQVGAARNFAVFSAVGYSLLPQIDTQLFFKGYFDVLALGIMPWLFGALIGKRWRYMYIFAILVASISYPHTYLIIMVGLSVLVFTRAVVPGAIVMMIGWLVMKFDSAVFAAAVSPYYTSSAAIPSFLQTYVLDRTIGSLAYNVRVNAAYVITLLQGLAFIPLLALRRNERWDMVVLGLWAIVSGAFVLGLFRSAGWEFPRNSFYIVPVYFAALVACLNLNSEFARATAPVITMFRDAPSALLFFSMTSVILVGGVMFNSPPLASHFPWGASGQILESEDTRSWKRAMSTLSTLVPGDASIAWRAGPEVQAYLTNRQHSWYMGREPEGVKYYVFIGKALNAAEQREWVDLIDRLRQRRSMKLLYDGVPGKPLLVFENLDDRQIPRNESLLGWAVLRGVFSKGKAAAPAVEK